MESTRGGNGGVGGLPLLTKPTTTISSSFVSFHQNPLLFSWKLNKIISSSDSYTHYYILLRRSYIRTSTTSMCSPNWDSNAEPVSSKRFKFQFRGNRESGNDSIREGEGEEEVSSRKRRSSRKRKWLADEPPNIEAMQEEGQRWILEETIDSLWIIKVFRSYGWTLAPIIVSWLIATGPKAFIMTLALPLGLSVLVFAFEKLLGKKLSKPKRKSRKRRKPSFTGAQNAGMDDDLEEKQESVEGKMGYQSWVVNDNGSFKKDGEEQEVINFGGWDELDRMGAVEHRRRQRPKAGQSRQTRTVNGKLSKEGGKSGLPLLLRLLIAVFPFLGSWTRML